LRGRICLFLACFPALFCGLADINSWPFSNYPMYSAPIRFGPFKTYALYIVTHEGTDLEIRDREFLWHLNYQRMQVKAKALKNSPYRRTKIQAMLRYYSRRALSRYRKEGKREGFPEKVQLRLSYGNFVVRNSVLCTDIDRYEILGEVINTGE